VPNCGTGPRLILFMVIASKSASDGETLTTIVGCVNNTRPELSELLQTCVSLSLGVCSPACQMVVARVIGIGRFPAP
jgi:hypothetical protein